MTQAKVRDVTLADIAEAYRTLGNAKPPSGFQSERRTMFTRRVRARIVRAQGRRIAWQAQMTPLYVPVRRWPKPPAWMQARHLSNARYTLMGKRLTHGLFSACMGLWRHGHLTPAMDAAARAAPAFDVDLTVSEARHDRRAGRETGADAAG